MKSARRIGTALALSLVLAAVAFPASKAFAQIEKEKSIFTVTEPTEIGDKVVPPGTYLIRVVPLSYNRNLVQVTSEDGTKVFAAALATPHPKKLDDQQPASSFLYYPAKEGQTKTLRTWFAPSTPFGQDIVYGKKRAAELAASVHENVVAIPEETKEAEYKTVPYTTVTSEGSEAPYTAPLDHAAPQTTVAESNPAPAPAEPAPLIADNSSTKLPHTASSLPLSALAGVLALGAALSLRRARVG